MISTTDVTLGLMCIVGNVGAGLEKERRICEIKKGNSSDCAASILIICFELFMSPKVLPDDYCSKCDAYITHNAV